ncbi:MAG: peptidase M19 [Christiangramia sp.]
MKSHFFVDIHCHPSIKPFARSFRKKPGLQSRNPRHAHSVWFHDAPSLFDKIKNYIATLTNFVQSDGTSLRRGRVAVVCLSFYPQEKGFFDNKLGTGLASDILTKLATEFGQARIDHLQSLKSYWEDFKLETKFMKQESGNPVTVDGKKTTYYLTNSYAEIELLDREEKLANEAIVFIPTIEGAHIFDQVMDGKEPANKFPEGVSKKNLELMLQRITDLREEKNGLIRPVFITLAHHFWNGLCGHARSLGGLVKCVVDQENGLNLGITKAGEKAIDAMLKESKDSNGNSIKPIFIDIKHMSRTSRLDYFKLLKNYPEKNIPIIASHACVTGLSQPGGEHKTRISQENIFNTDDINFFDDEIIRIAKSNGLFGIQLDERRIGSKSVLRDTKAIMSKRNTLYSWSKLVWNQVSHIAEVLDAHDQFAWGIQSLGTDFDGIIDPIDGYWTAEQIDYLDDYLLMHAYNYIKEIKIPCPLQQERNKKIEPEKIVERIMTSNALEVLSRMM